ncbi:hypothetical protein M0802_004273 [Mischocyttarus mexicanus]|nr:hypothetical protein M0802_004273 [Mischocyttarus mexicanus]
MGKFGIVLKDLKIVSGHMERVISIEAHTKVDTEDVTGTRARNMYGQSAVFPRLPVIQSAKWKDRNGLWFGFGIIHYAAHNTPSPATAVLHRHSRCASIDRIRIPVLSVSIFSVSLICDIGCTKHYGSDCTDALLSADE